MPKRISYFYDNNMGNYSYGSTHPMKPHRIKLAHELIMAYNIDKKLECFNPAPIDASEFLKFHTDDYIDFLNTCMPENQSEYLRECARFNIDSDSPIFNGIFDYCLSYTGSSLACAHRINRKSADVAINWSGGLHHAKRSEASGFCYVNDIVLSIAELLKTHKRVLYIDIDVHHGDGVEEAFYLSDRVLTLSLHRYGDFFPGTGHIKDNGINNGRDYSVNVPLLEGMDDESYEYIFNPIIDRCIEKFGPEAIVLQSGTDSLAHDRLGCFNLSSKGHSNCTKKIKETGIPLVVLGGGGYTVRNVARCWAKETAVLTGSHLKENSNGKVRIPFHEYYDYYAPEHHLEVESLEMVNKNETEELDKIKESIFAQLNRVEVRNNSSAGQEISNSKVGERIDEWERIKKENDSYELTDRNGAQQSTDSDDSRKNTKTKKTKLWEAGAREAERKREEEK